ncbi:hypothetical protein Pint_22778 [Pistacia integerrima]|uniref:Uncharacterized protein n=1 Tax=Pistacia integerrima TaxID=434235 RepID=A0ACC0YNK5_9ROSI|nr:hypothetical protein Pint_22778 [Pistacia integerrima]
MISNSPLLIKFFTIQCLMVLCVSQGFDFFYFIQQLPGSYCDTKQSCCYPKTEKPATNFTIHGLRPNDLLNSEPSYCKSKNPYKESKISDLIKRLKISWPTLACPGGSGSKLWSNEWKNYGTCSESVLDQHAYFKAALDLKDKKDLLKVLKKSGIKPNGKVYGLSSILESIRGVVGYEPGVKCNGYLLEAVQPTSNSLPSRD